MVSSAQPPASSKASSTSTTPGDGDTVLANGENVTSSGFCRDTILRIDKESFLLDCYSIPLAGFDIVLGVQWLSTLGPIVWDFTLMTISFRRNDCQVTWQDMQSPTGDT